jgi:hypothetical protein
MAASGGESLEVTVSTFIDDCLNGALCELARYLLSQKGVQIDGATFYRLVDRNLGPVLAHLGI